MQTLLPDCSVRKLQPVNADIEKIYAMVCAIAVWQLIKATRKVTRFGQKTVMLFVAPKSLTIFSLISPCKKN